MKRNITTLVTALSMVILATAAFAQDTIRIRRDMAPGGDELASALNLSTDQKVQWDAIHQQLEASVTPLFAQHRDAEIQLNVLVDSSNPDPTAVGRQYLAMRAIGLQIKTAHEATRSKIDAILTPDQKAKFDAIHARMENGEHGPMIMMKMHGHEGGSE